MFRSYSCGIVAAIGLALLASSGQAEEHENEPDRSPDEQQQSTEPLSIPVRIIESQEAAETRQSAENETTEREKADLIAQQGMDAATRRMAELAKWQTFLIAVGTGALIYTLHLTRQANKAAQDAVKVTREIGEAQVRAYIAEDAIVVSMIWDESDPPNWQGFNLGMKAVNTGQSPALNVHPYGAYYIGETPTIECEDLHDQPGEIGANRGVTLSIQKVLNPVAREVFEGKAALYYIGLIAYEDVFSVADNRKEVVWKLFCKRVTFLNPPPVAKKGEKLPLYEGIRTTNFPAHKVRVKNDPRKKADPFGEQTT